MKSLKETILAFLRLGKNGSHQDVSALRNSFRKHYRNFRALLTANNNTLEIMAEMEETLTLGRPFSMAFIRGHCTALTANVYKMIKLLQDLSGGGYQELSQSFSSISSEIDAILALQPKVTSGPHVLTFAELDRNSADQVGEKMANLGEVRNRIGLGIPDGFVITAAGTSHFMVANNLQSEIRRRLRTIDPENLEELFAISASIQALITSAPIPADLEKEIQDHYRQLADKAGKTVDLAMRSSATGEDSGSASFAGQYRTQLHVDREFLGLAFKEIVAAKYRSQAIIYRLQRGYRHQDVTMCVGCLVMIDAAVSGVIYSRSPEEPGSRILVISAAPGLGGKVVEGREKADLYLVQRQSPHSILGKELQSGSAGPHGALTGDQVRELARIGVRLEEHFGTPQDIEWTIDRRGEVYILQSRPLKQQQRPELAAVLAELPATGTVPLLSGGIAVTRGVAAGPVHIVRNNIDLLQFPRGAVLVIEHPLPEYAALMGRAVAVISDSGHLTTHLATIAREFRMPAIFGMAQATAKLRNGDMVTVDAGGCRIYAGCREEILARAEPPPNLMVDSPVYAILRKVLQHITPLNLTDPASPFFRPSSCGTYHDLTRFCHEKAVAEMFSFGSRYGFDQGAARRLVGETPYDWWVIDLEDGFREGAERHGKFIHIDDIVSLPMRAIWEGMTAVPWQGPPPLNIRGFGSIIFQSTMNRNIEPAVRSNMATRNYFLVARNFCNLSVRLGYHFAMVEAFLSDFLTESYVSFQFKGGAADATRRLMRVRLLGEVLRQFGFRTEQKGDSLTARIEKKPVPYLEGRLMILGYLLIHARLIDMAMGEEASVAGFRRKMMADLEAILGRMETPADYQG
jgi:pyruvate, water dikinase